MLFALVPDLCILLILSSTANATLFLISSYSFVSNIKTFVCDNHLNDPTTFLHHQIQVCTAHARILDLGYKNDFPCFTFMKTEMSKFAMQRK